MRKDNRKLAREYLIKHQGFPIQAISRLMAKENPKIWNRESARKCLMRILGKSGLEDRIKATDKSMFLGTNISPVNNPFGLPESDIVEVRPYIATGNMALIVSDLHIPYHDVAAITTALRYAKERKVDTIILLGDLMDGYTLSKFEQDVKMRDFAGELKCTRQFLSVLRKNFPDAKIIFREGNHEYRFERYLMRNAPALIGIDEFDLKVLLKTFDNGIEYVKGKRLIKFGKLNVLHGDEYSTGGGGAVNPARSMFLKTLECTLSGHNHRTSNHTEMTLEEKQISTWSIGCLCGLQPKYMPFNKWNSGFAIVEREGDNNFTVYNHRIIKGRIY